VTVTLADDVTIDDVNMITIDTLTTNGDADSDRGNVDIDTAGSVTIIGLMTVNGALDIDTDANGGTGGDIADLGGQLLVTGTTLLDAGTGDTTLDNPLNEFIGAVTVTLTDDLTIDDANSLIFGMVTATGDANIDTAGTVSFTGLATIGGNADVKSDENGGTGADITDDAPAGQLLITGTTTLDAGDSDITLDNPLNDFGGMGVGTTMVVNIINGKDVTLVDVNDIHIDADVNALTGSLSVSALGGDGGANSLVTANVFGNIFITDSVVDADTITTTGSQSYDGNVTLNGTTVLNSLTGGAVTFANRVNGAAAATQALTVNTAGATTFGGTVGVGNDDLFGTGDDFSLASVLTDAPGSVVFTGEFVSTSGDQTYLEAARIDTSALGITTTTFNGNNITFDQTLDATSAGVENLVVNSTGAGLTTFGSAAVDGTDDDVGRITALGTITTNADGTTVFNSSLVNSFGDQTYNDNTVISFSGTGNDTTTLTAVGTGIANVTVGTAPPAGTLVNANTLMGLPLGDASGIPNNNLVANSDACVIVHSAISGIFSVNGTSGVCWLGANPLNTGIRMYFSQPVAPLVFLFNAPPAQYRVNQFLIDMGTLFSQDLQNLVRYPEVNYPVSQLDYNALREAQRQGLLPTDLILSTYDLFAEDEEEEE
jgi:hypothetical protein